MCRFQGRWRSGKAAGRVSVNVSRALAKTVTYEVVTAVSEFGANYLFVRDLAAASGLTASSIVIAPFVYYVHEKAWDYLDANKAQSPGLGPSQNRTRPRSEHHRARMTSPIREE